MYSDSFNELKQNLNQLNDASKWADLEKYLQDHSAELQSDPDFYLWSARVKLHNFQLDDSKDWLHRGIEQFPDYIPLKRELAVVLGLQRSTTHIPSEE